VPQPLEHLADGQANTDEPALAGSGRISRRSVVIGLLVGVPASAAFLWFAVRGLDPGRVWTNLGNANPLWVAAAVGCMALVYVVQAERWRRIARHTGSAPRRHFLALVISSVAVNNVIPGRPGELLRGYWLGRVTRVPAARALSTVIVDRAADLLALLALLAASFPFVDHPTWVRQLFFATVGLGVLLAAGLGAAWWYAEVSTRGRAREQAGLERSRLRRQISGLVRGVAASVSLRDLVPAGLLSIAAWLIWALGVASVAASLGIDLSPLEWVFITAVMNLGVAIPSSPGFVGTYQWLAVAALGLFAVGRDEAFAFSVVMQAVWFVPTTLAGILIALRAGASLRNLGRMEHSVVNG
jgi:glycosyltransferase 2 family protein